MSDDLSQPEEEERIADGVRVLRMAFKPSVPVVGASHMGLGWRETWLGVGLDSPGRVVVGGVQRAGGRDKSHLTVVVPLAPWPGWVGLDSLAASSVGVACGS